MTDLTRSALLGLLLLATGLNTPPAAAIDLKKNLGGLLGSSTATLEDTAAQTKGTTTALAGDSDFSRDHRPCLKELCVGDGLDALAGFKWERAISPSRSHPQAPVYLDSVAPEATDLRKAHNNYRGAVDPIAHYLIEQRFDAKALAQLPKVTADCSDHQINGRYLSEAGNPTEVWLKLLPGQTLSDPQVWTVVRIIRLYPGVTSGPQFEQVKQQLDERYAAYDFINNRRGLDPAAKGHYQLTAVTTPQMALMLTVDSDIGSQLLQTTACGGNGGAPVSIE